VVEDAKRIHELLTDSALVWQGANARVLDCQFAGDGLDDGLARMVILGPRIDLQVWVSVIPKVLDEPLDDLPIGRNPLLLCHW
jgi:hypothetical protein